MTSGAQASPLCEEHSRADRCAFQRRPQPGACIGHISPEALAGGPIGRVQEGDIIEIVIDRAALTAASILWAAPI